MGEKSPHVVCKLCNTAHPLGGPHSWDKPSATKEQRIAIADAVVKAKSGGGSSAVERRPSKPTVEGSTPSPRSKQTAASPKAKGRPSRGKALSPDSVAALSPNGPAGTPKRRGRPSTGFDKKAYDRQKAAERRAARKALRSQGEQP